MANFEPIRFPRKFGAIARSESAQSTAGALEESPFVDVSGVSLVRAAVTGACRKCGYVGHLAFQCRNFLQPKDSDACLDVSSTSSDSEYETPLTSKELVRKKKSDGKKHKKERKEKKKRKEKKRRKRKHSSGNERLKKKRKSSYPSDSQTSDG